MQGGILEISLGQHSYGSPWYPEGEEDSAVKKATASITQAVPETGRVLIITGSIFLVLGFVALLSAIRWVRKRRLRYLQIHLAEPLM